LKASSDVMPTSRRPPTLAARPGDRVAYGVLVLSPK
jgi:hypothetical protein